MLSIISGAIVFICSSYVGIEIRRHYKKRLKLIIDIYDFYTSLINNLSYSKEPINIFCGRFCGGKKGDIVTLLTIYTDAISVSERPILKTTLLKKSEIAFFAENLYNIGKTNIQMELKRAESAKVYFDGLAKIAQRELDTNGKLAYKLGVLLGIALMVLLV